MTTRSRRTYDHRVKEQIIRTRNPDPFPELGIPRSTAVSWIRRGLGEVVSVDDDREEGAVLHERIVKLENRISMLTALLRWPWLPSLENWWCLLGICSRSGSPTDMHRWLEPGRSSDA